MEDIIPPNAPSKVLFGLTFGKAKFCPKFLPMRYAIISLTELIIIGIQTRIKPLSSFLIIIAKLNPKPEYKEIKIYDDQKLLIDIFL